MCLLILVIHIVTYVLMISRLKSATHQKTPSHTHKIVTPTKTNRQVMKQRKETQATGTTTKPQRHSQGQHAKDNERKEKSHEDRNERSTKQKEAQKKN